MMFNLTSYQCLASMEVFQLQFSFLRLWVAFSILRPKVVSICCGCISLAIRWSLMTSKKSPNTSGNENLTLSVLFFIIVMDSGSLNGSCARALTLAWLHIIRPTHLCLVYGREIVGPGSMTAHYCTKKENEMKK